MHYTRRTMPDIEYTLDPAIYYLPDSQPADDYARKTCRLDLYRPLGVENFPTIVYFHGGGIVFGDRFVPDHLKRQGWAVATADYRLHPIVKHPTYIEDAAAAVAWTRRNIASLGGDPNRIVIAGSSAGAYLALMIGLDKQYLAAHGIDADSFAALLPMIGQVITHQTVRKEQGITPADLRPTIDRFAPLYHIRRDAPPILCVTGDWHLDMHCRAHENAYFVAMMKHIGHPDIEHVVIPGIGHDDNPPQCWTAALKFLHRVLDARNS